MTSSQHSASMFSPSVESDWIRWLRRHTDTSWRPGEWDHELWLCTADPGNPQSTVDLCVTRACTQILGDRGMCTHCVRALSKSGISRDEFIDTHVPDRPRTKYGQRTEQCRVERNGVRCARRFDVRGLCRRHYSEWRTHSRQNPATELGSWVTCVAEPLGPEQERMCLVLGCLLTPRGAIPLCPLHYTRRKTNTPDTPVEVFARTQPPYLGANQFSLGHLSEQLRWEVLYAVQQRDHRNGRLSPGVMRQVVQELERVPSVATMEEKDLPSLIASHGASSVQAHLVEFARSLRQAHDEMLGIEHTEKMVWDLVTLGVQPDPAMLGGPRRRAGTIDFGEIEVEWLRELTRTWARTELPEGRIMLETVRAAALAARTLRQRADLGERPPALDRADMDQVVEVFRTLSHADGAVLSVSRRRTMARRFFELIEYGRINGRLNGLGPGFNRHRFHMIPFTGDREEEVGRALPASVLRQLDANLDRIGVGFSHGELTPGQVNAMFRTIFIVLRDTGRRPLEVASLLRDCVTGNDEPTLHWNNIKSKRLGRKLPITRATAAAIGEWQEIRQTLPAPPASSEYLFPAKSSIAREPFIRTHYISRVMRAWVDQIDRLDSDTVDADGNPIPFDRTLVYPYTLRHTYAQRHADAGVPVDVLRDLMDHKHINTTTIYYEITTSRKREAVATVASFTVDRAGRPAPMNDQAAYEVRAVAVPFGNCIEPSNVKAGGGACPVRFQCAGCGFYRPDPSYLTAIEEHLNSLKADRETAHAMNVAGFVVENLTAQIDAFTHVHQTMTDQLDTLAPDERARVDEASAVLRKSRADIAGRSLPLHVIGKNTAT